MPNLDSEGAGALPVAYAWLRDELGPKMITEALKLFGTLEAPGARDNPTILAWAKEVGQGDVYVHDSIAWCGLFMAVVAKRAGKPIPDKPLWALSWGEWGRPAPAAMLGDVLTFRRDSGGHVALYVGEDAEAYHCLGGNQSDKVCFTRIAKSRLYRARRPAYNVQPANVRRVMLAANGRLSHNEA